MNLPFANSLAGQNPEILPDGSTFGPFGTRIVWRNWRNTTDRIDYFD
jgi:hypothetical protein